MKQVFKSDKYVLIVGKDTLLTVPREYVRWWRRNWDGRYIDGRPSKFQIISACLDFNFRPVDQIAVEVIAKQINPRVVSY